MHRVGSLSSRWERTGELFSMAIVCCRRKGTMVSALNFPLHAGTDSKPPTGRNFLGSKFR